MSKFKKALSVTATVIAGLIIVLSVTAITISLLTPAGKAPAFFGYSFFYTLSDSMEPTIPSGSLITVRLLSDDTVITPGYGKGEGDIITFYSSDPALDGGVLTHRAYLPAGDDAFYTWGDNAPYRDEYVVRREEIIGVVTSVSPFLGNVIGFLSKRPVFFAAVILPLAYFLVRIILFFRRRIIEELKNE